MSILASLARAYDRLPDAPPFGFSLEKIGFLISLNADGSVASVSDLRTGEGKKKVAPAMLVPQPVKRTAGIAPNFLWDKTSYVLGVTAEEGKRTADEHAAFIQRHETDLANTDDAGLRALLLFLKNWSPDQFAAPAWPEEMKDQNVAFTLEDERLRNIRLHDRQAAKDLWGKLSAAGERDARICLVTGEPGPVARLHPSIKGVWGAQSSGAALVSFNLDSFTSYGHEQGDNAPVSELAAAKYTTALNRFLERDSGHRIQIGDASTVFWADASEVETAQLAESIFEAIVGGVDEKMQAAKVGDILKKVRAGAQIKEISPDLERGVRFYVLGLAPNAARLSVRYWFDDDFGVLAENYEAYVKDMAFEPWPSNRPTPTVKSCVLRTGIGRRERGGQLKFDTDSISPLLSGELLRSILTGTRFPRSLLAHLIMRVRSDHVLDSTRIALIKGLLVRTMRIENRLPKHPDGTSKEDYLVRSDPNDQNEARRLGRLFAVLERTQLASLGDEINTTIKDKFLGVACATPGQVMVELIKLSQHHTKRLRNGHSDAAWIAANAKKQGVPVYVLARRVGAALEGDIGRLAASFKEGFSQQHSSEEQGLFLVGYYQERFGGKADPESGDQPDIDTDRTEVNGEE
ncbi:type I-C CRISPR-associated protein Cas8c/Csd1 [Rhizobium sp. LjRoot30]|uniref:type I-C CRISPR-associated protein Cas8c/Csd1 n=1 Tax=Rhizobium sp. LjRoot30 TaxID=3342320 RepID=UPI003ECCBD7C